MQLIETHTVTDLSSPSRLSTYATGKFGALPSHQGIKKAIKKGLITVNGNSCNTAYWVKEGDCIELYKSTENNKKQLELPIDVIFEDEFCAVVNKPAGLIISGNQHRTLANALSFNLAESSQVDAFETPLPVHRLDSATSGLVVVSKTRTAHYNLSKQFEDRAIKKRYQAIIGGILPDKGAVNTPIDDKESYTEYKIVKTINSVRNQKLHLVDLYPHTGRTHQLRIHMSSIGCPIMGDLIYGVEGNTLKHKGLFLAAVELWFSHPITNELMNITINTPKKFDKLIERELKNWDKHISS